MISVELFHVIKRNTISEGVNGPQTQMNGAKCFDEQFGASTFIPA